MYIYYIIYSSKTYLLYMSLVGYGEKYSLSIEISIKNTRTFNYLPREYTVFYQNQNPILKSKLYKGIYKYIYQTTISL